MDLIPSAVSTIQQMPQQKALLEMRTKRTMESEETKETAGKSKRSRESRAISKFAIALEILPRQ